MSFSDYENTLDECIEADVHMTETDIDGACVFCGCYEDDEDEWFDEDDDV